jgi:hypothetical protein
MVDKNPKRLKWRTAARNRVGVVALGVAGIAILIAVGMSGLCR